MEMKASQDWWCQEVLRDVFHGKGWLCNATQWLQTTTLGRFSGKGSARLCKAGCQTFYAMCVNRVATHRPQESNRRTYPTLHVWSSPSAPACEPRMRKRTSGWLRRRAARRREPRAKCVHTQRTLPVASDEADAEEEGGST